MFNDLGQIRTIIPKIMDKTAEPIAKVNAIFVLMKTDLYRFLV